MQLSVLGLAAMVAAMDRGDVDDAARQGAIAGPVIVERALRSHDRATRLAGIAAAPAVEDRAELLPALADLAASPDRRVAIPAATAARAIARRLAARELPDDLAPEDVDAWRARFEGIARAADRFVEVRVVALDTAAALAAGDALGFDLDAQLADRDPALRAEALALVPRPLPAALRASISRALAGDPDPVVALRAAEALCGDGETVDARGLARIRELIAKHPSRDAARCVTK